MEGTIALFRKSFETLKRFPQLFAFPALCWAVGLVTQAVLGGLLVSALLNGSALSWAAFGLASFSNIFVQLIVQVVVAYFSAGQIRGMFLANEGRALTLALFTEGYQKYGGRVLAAKVLRIGLMIGIGIVGTLLIYALSFLGTLITAAAIGALALITMFWEIMIVRDNAPVPAALAGSVQAVTKNLGAALVPMIIIGLAQAIIASIFGGAAWLASAVTGIVLAPFAGLVMINVLENIKAGATTISG